MDTFNGCEPARHISFADYLIVRCARRFPIRENGMNLESQPLQLHEIALMKEDSAVIERIKSSYELMLDFYGMCLLDFETGLLGRSEGYAARYRNLLRE